MAGNKGLKSKELVKVPPNKIPRIIDLFVNV